MEKKAKLPDVDYIVDKFLTDNSHYRLTSRRSRIETAKVLRKVLGKTLDLYRRKPVPSLPRILILKVVDLELNRGSNYKEILEKLDEEDEADFMKLDSLFMRYSKKYGISSWIDIADNEKASAAFQTWLSRQRKRLRDEIE